MKEPHIWMHRRNGTPNTYFCILCEYISVPEDMYSFDKEGCRNNHLNETLKQADERFRKQ